MADRIGRRVPGALHLGGRLRDDLVNEVMECGLSFETCTMSNLGKLPVPKAILTHLGEMVDDQGHLRKERNSRFHHGAERGFSSDDQTLRYGSLFEQRFNGAVRFDRTCRLKVQARFF